jgi:histidinol dehydrogenase
VQILEWAQLDSRAQAQALARPQVHGAQEVLERVREIIESVRSDGDAAVRRFTRRFDDVELQELRVSRGELAAARQSLSSVQVAALERAIRNVSAFHSAQQTPDRISIETEPGVRCEHLIQPIESVGLYVPAGSAALPSAVIMLGVPAGIAGCQGRILCTPPNGEGLADPAVLVAAQLCGIHSVFKVGGAQAIAALAYGTQSIPRVNKIFGPGSAWVTAAKQIVAQDPQGAVCDLPAGPSEVMIIADETARPEFLAADLLAQAEHDVLAQSILVTTSARLARAVASGIEEALPKLSRQGILKASVASIRCLLVPGIETALEVANRYAPEHLLLQVADPRSHVADVRSAGAIFLGPWSAETLGDYCTGANHVLPTYGYARTLSGLSLKDFTRSVTVQEVSREGLTALGPTAVTLSRLEGLDAHALAVTSRLEALGATAT